MIDAQAVAMEERPGAYVPEYSVKRLDEADAARWDAFVHDTDDATFYHLSGWKSLIENELRHPAHYLYCEREGRIRAVLPLVHVQSLLFGNALISVPFLVYGGPVGTDRAALRQVTDAALDLARELGVDHLELRNVTPLEGDWVGKSTSVTFRKAIDPDPDRNLKAIPRKQRAMIRKGMKFELQAECDEDTRRLYDAMLACKRNLGTPFFGPAWLEAIKDRFADQAEIMTITHRKRTVCSVMSFRFRNEILPYYGGGGEIARDLKGNDFMYWAVMEKACKDGVEIFDFGRSTEGSGAYRFKKHWGFEPRTLAYQYRLFASAEVPEHNPANPRYRLMINAWKKLPLPVAGLIGPRIARCIG